MTVGNSGDVTNDSYNKAIIACNENDGSWTYQPSDCWIYLLYSAGAKATGRRLIKMVGGSATTVFSIPGPGDQASWCMRIIQDVSEPTDKIRALDGADADSLVEQGTADDTANSGAANIWTGMMTEMKTTGSVGTMTIDDFEVVTPQ